ncbi:MAG: extracellular solute-binding protein [Lachnospiraceae bacterium]
MFDVNSGEYQFDDRIAREIMKQTGVKINIMDPTDDVTEKVSLMLAYQDYPDMILINMDNIQKYVEAGYLVDLEPYMEQLPNVKSMYGDVLNRLRTEDGKLYYLSNWYGVDEDASSAFQIRYDYLCELVGKERADSNEPFTQDEFLDLLRRFQKKHPESEGKTSLPLALCTSLNYNTPLRGMYGMKYYYENNGKLYHLTRDPKYGN